MLVEEYKEKAISENDPLLMLVNVHQSIMEDYGKMLGHHKQAVRTVMEKVVGSRVKAIRETVEELRTKTLEGSLKDFVELVRQAASRRRENTMDRIEACCAGAALGVGHAAGLFHLLDVVFSATIIMILLIPMIAIFWLA